MSCLFSFRKRNQNLFFFLNQQSKRPKHDKDHLCVCRLMHMCISELHHSDRSKEEREPRACLWEQLQEEADTKSAICDRRAPLILHKERREEPCSYTTEHSSTVTVRLSCTKPRGEQRHSYRCRILKCDHPGVLGCFLRNRKCKLVVCWRS